MANVKNFLDFNGLEAYDKLIKEYIKTGSTDEIDKIIDALAALAVENGQRDDLIKANADAIDVLNGDKDTEGSVDQKVNAAITALIDGAPEALDTLKEIADWINDDETGTAALIKRVSDNEEAIQALQEKDIELKEYIDSQDEMYFDAIQSIEDLRIKSLFPKEQAKGVSAMAAIAAIEEGDALKLQPEQEIVEDVVIEKDCYIDANGAVFAGTVTVPAGANVIIENATFNKPVVVE